tara:strand:- start:197 stop:811 length:615 start_codon:yes stop_codon:yes gene_type:complete
MCKETITSKVRYEVVRDVVKYIVMGVLIFIATLFKPMRDSILEPWNLKEDILAIQLQTLSLERENLKIRSDIAALRAPKDVFEVSTLLSGPVNDFCVPGEVCSLEVWVRRVAGSEDCKIDGSKTQHWILTKEDTTKRRVSRISSIATTNIGTEWEPLIMDLEIPDTISEGEAYYIVVAFYTDCPFTNEIVRDEGEPISFEIRMN